MGTSLTSAMATPQSETQALSGDQRYRALLAVSGAIVSHRDLSALFHALADPGRRVMVERLTRGPASVSELGRPLAMSLAAVLQHVQVLEASRLVRSQKTGRTRTCTVDPAVLRSAEQWLSDRRALSERRLDRLGAYLADTAGPADAGP